MRFAVIDTETTGVEKGSRIIELAVGVVENGSYVDSRLWRFDPGVPIPAGATRVHGWDAAKIKAAGLQPFTAVDAADLASVLEGADGPVYVHNLDYDLDTILLPEFARVGADAAALAALPWSCTLKMARELWPGLENNLGAVADRLGVEFNGAAHSAGVDVDVLRRIVEQIVHRYAYRAHRGALVKPVAPAMVAAPASTDQLLELAGAKAAPFVPRVKAAQEWVAGLLICDDEDEALAHQGLANVKRLQAEAEAERKSVVEPVKQIGSKIDALYRETIARPCESLRGDLEQKLGVYAAAKLRKQRELEAAAAAKLAAERAEADRIAREAAAKQAAADAAAAAAQAEAVAAELAARRAGDAAAVAAAQAQQAEVLRAQEAAAAQLQAEQAAQAAHVQDAMALVVSASDPASGAGPVKTLGASGGYTVKRVARIVDPAKVPDTFWRPDLDLVQKAVDQGAREIAGVVIDEVVQVANRRRG